MAAVDAAMHQREAKRRADQVRDRDGRDGKSRIHLERQHRREQTSDAEPGDRGNRAREQPGDDENEIEEQLVQPLRPPRPGGGRFGSGLKAAGNRSNTEFIAVTALACSAISLSTSVSLPLI